jgi:hypothetical protein
MHVKRVFTTLTFGSLVAMTLLAAHPAAAVDGKTYPDSMCRPGSGDATPFFAGTLNTDANAAHSVICPVVRETIAAAGIAFASITVRDLSPVEDVECVLFSARPDGSLVASSRRTSSGVNTAPQTLAFGGLAAADSGHYSITCRIPRRDGNNYSGIVAYRVDENE